MTTIAVTQDPDGTMHFAGDPPQRAVIDIHGICYIGGDWLKIDSVRGTITITLDGRTVVYRKVSNDIHGKWICERE